VPRHSYTSLFGNSFKASLLPAENDGKLKLLIFHGVMARNKSERNEKWNKILCPCTETGWDMRPAFGPRLFLRKRKDSAALWYIRDGVGMQSTGLLEHQVSEAEAALLKYAGNRRVSITIPNMTRPDTVYFASCDIEGFPIKIGVAADVERRLRQIQGHMPFEVILLATAPGGMVRERKLHIAFRESRLHGEWFARTPDLMSEIGFYVRRAAA
jgi:hypothetical protein